MRIPERDATDLTLKNHFYQRLSIAKPIGDVMKNSIAKTVAFYGVAMALMFVFLLIETELFAVWFGSFTPSILTLPFAVALSLTDGFKKSWIGGTIFGCCSFFLAVIIANPVFINPLVSILPRVFIGVTAYGASALANRLCGKNNHDDAENANIQNNTVNKILPASIGGAVGILTNSVCTIFMMWVFKSSGLEAILTVIISVNFVAEVIGAIVLVPIYQKAFSQIQR